MRVTAQTHRSHGQAILQAAASLFRVRGIGSVSVADVTQAAGLTHGAFYGHFASKAALAESACRGALEAGAARWRARAAAARAAGEDGLSAIIASYLTEQHRDEPQSGCAIASLGQEMARGEPGLQTALADGTTALLDVLEEEIALPHPSAAIDQHRAAALGALSAMAGGLVIARAFADPDRSRAALQAASRAAHAAASLS